MFEDLEVSKHPKYGTELTRGRRGNGWCRSKIRQHKLECGLKNTLNAILTTGVFFNKDKNRLVWFNSMWHRKFWRRVFNRRLRHIEDIPNYGSYRKKFFLELNCDMIRLVHHGIKKVGRECKEKIVTTKYYESQVRPTWLQWSSIYGRT